MKSVVVKSLGHYARRFSFGLILVAIVILCLLAWLLLGRLSHKPQPIQFVTYQQNEVALTSWGSPSGITFKIDIPQGDHPQLEKAIRHIISTSRMVQELGEPIGETFKEMADNSVEMFREVVSKDEYAITQFDLLIELEYQNSQCVVYHVTDGVYLTDNGNPREYDLVIRLSDGHIMDQLEMIYIADDTLRELIKRFADGEQREHTALDEGYFISPCAEGCKVLWPYGHSIGECVIPHSEIDGYLSDEALPLFTADSE